MKPHYAIFRAVPRPRLDAALLRHNIGESRPDHARDDSPAIVYHDGRKEARSRLNELLADRKRKGITGFQPNRAVDIIFAGPPEYEADDAWSPERNEQWAKDSLAWLKQTFPECAVAVAARHRDENSPHVHVTMVPIVDGALGWGKVQNKVTGKRGRERYVWLQDSYHAAVGEKYGLRRGITDPDRKHKPLTREAGLKAARKELRTARKLQRANEEAERQLKAVADQLEDMGQPHRADVIRRASELPEKKLELMVRRLDTRMGQEAKEVFAKELARTRERHDARMARMREKEIEFMDAFEKRAAELKQQIAGWEAIARKKPFGVGAPLAHAGA